MRYLHKFLYKHSQTRIKYIVKFNSYVFLKWIKLIYSDIFPKKIIFVLSYKKLKGTGNFLGIDGNYAEVYIFEHLQFSGFIFFFCKMFYYSHKL